jgi:hypothetical protein
MHCTTANGSRLVQQQLLSQFPATPASYSTCAPAVLSTLSAYPPGNWLNVAIGPLRGTDTGLNGTGACAASASAAALALAAPLLLLASAASGRGRHSNSPTAPAALPSKLRVTVPGPPVGGGFAGLNGLTAAASAVLRVAWWMGSARYWYSPATPSAPCRSLSVVLLKPKPPAGCSDHGNSQYLVGIEALLCRCYLISLPSLLDESDGDVQSRCYCVAFCRLHIMRLANSCTAASLLRRAAGLTHTLLLPDAHCAAAAAACSACKLCTQQ